MEEDLKPLPATEDGGNWEISLGVRWFSWAGIVALLVGLAMFLNYSFDSWKGLLTHEVKIALAGLLSIGMFFGGQWMLRRYQLLGRILQGGGLSLGYLTLYGMFFIPEVQLFSHQSIGWGLLFLYVGGMIGVSRRMQSRSVAILSLAFGYYTASYSGSQLTALASTTLLGMAAIVLSRFTPGWRMIAKIGCAGAFLTFAYWAGHVIWLAPEVSDRVRLLPAFLISPAADAQLYLLLNYVVFQGAALLPVLGGQGRRSDVAFSALSTFAAFGCLQWFRTDSLFALSGSQEALFSAVTLTIALLALRNRTGEGATMTQANVSLAVLFAVTGVLAAFGAQTEAVALAGMSVLLAVLGRGERFATMFRALSCIVLLVGLTALCRFNWYDETAATLLLTVGSVAVSGLALERLFFRKAEAIVKAPVLVLISLLFLAALMIGLEDYWITLSMVVTSFALLMGGFVLRETSYRWTALGWLFLSVFRLLVVDMVTLETPYKILLFLALGVTLLIGSFAYNHLSTRKATERKRALAAAADPYSQLEE